MPTELAAADLLGRGTELAGLAELLDGPGGGAMVVLGEAGSGKTALLEVAAAEAESRRLRVLRVTGYAAESRYPYAGLHQLLLPLLDELAQVDDSSGRTLSAVFRLEDRPLELPGITPAGASEAGEASRRLLRYANSGQRRLVIVDDLQWLDTESALALGALCRRLQAADVDLLIAVRGTTAPPELGLRTREYRLAPLTPADARALLKRTAPTLRGHARDTVLRQAAGNPLALVEFGRAVEADVPGRLGIFDDGPLPLPARLEALYSARAGDLPPPTCRALLIAATAGAGELGAALASGRIAIGPGDWIPAAEAGLITRDSGIPAFIHPLMRSAVYQAASYSRKADAHRNLAEALAGHQERRAWHLASSAWHPDEGIAALLEATARGAEARSGYHAGAVAWERAADLSPDPRDACRRLTAAARLADIASERAWSLKLAERAAAAGAEAGLGGAELVETQEYIGKGKVYLGADTNLVRDLLPALRAAAAEVRYTTTEIAALAATAAYYAPEPGQLAELRSMLDSLPDPFTRPEAWDEPRSADATLIYARAAVSPFLPWPDPLTDHGLRDPGSAEVDLEHGRSMFGASAYLLDQPELAARVLEPLLRNRPQSVDPTMLAAIASNNEMWGRWDEAVGQADQVIELATERGERFNLGFGHITAGLLAVRQGRTEQARRHARAADQAGDGVSRSIPTRTRHLHGLISLTEGDYQTAYTLLRGTLRTDERVPAHFHLSHYAVADFALAAQHTGQQDDAAFVLDGITAHADAMTAGGARWSRRMGLLHDLARALIADGEDASACFQRALSPGSGRWPFDQACARLHFGEHLRRTRRIAEARPLLAAALETFRGLGAVPWAQRAETELRAAGAAPGQPPDGLDPVAEAFAGLTPQQRAVAELAGDGLTNPQIGARLSISPKTVSIHLSRVFAQLGLTARSQLRDHRPGPGGQR